jgi:hypothetical protein
MGLVLWWDTAGSVVAGRAKQGLQGRGRGRKCASCATEEEEATFKW